MRFLKFYIIALGIVLPNFFVLSQSKFELSTGYGWSDLINARIKYGQKIQFGIGYGFLNIGENEILGPYFYSNSRNKEITFDLYYHFGGTSKFSKIKPWYFNGGICYFWSKDLNELPQYPGLFDQKYIEINLRMGRDLVFSNHVGISLNLGPILPFGYSDYHKKYKFNSMLPGFSINIFFRL